MNGADRNPVSTVTVTASVEGENIAVKVSPWRAPVFHTTVLHIVFRGAAGDTMRLEAKDATQWEDVAQPLPSQTVPSGARIPVTVKEGDKGTLGRYNIILTTKDGEIKIDPEIFICQ
jgi:hypothetical protein